MKNVITTTGDLSRQMILRSCGDNAGRFQDEAQAIIVPLCDLPSSDWTEDEWADIMYDRKGNVYAIWADGPLTSQDSICVYVELELEDCSEAFLGMEEQMDN